MNPSRSLWYVAPGKVELRPGAFGEGTRVRALYSGLSRGTERLVLQGRVPVSEHARMRCPNQEGYFPFPVKYGYALVGRAEDGEYAGRNVFLLHPHQEIAVVPATALNPVPLDVRETRWGPVLHELPDGRVLSLRWTAHLPGAIDLGLADFARAGDLDQALALADRAGVPTQNLVIGDREGRTPLALAKARDYAEMVRLLEKVGAR